MARKKTKADELYNIRRRLERQSARAMQQGKTVLARELFAEAQSYRKGGSNYVEFYRGSQSIRNDAISSPRRTAASRSARRNAIFRQQLNVAGDVGTAFTEVDRKAFFSATKQIWQGSEGDRLKAISNYFYKSNTQEAKDFKEWAKAQGEDLRSPNLFAVQAYVAEVNQDVLTSVEAVAMGCPRAFRKLVTFG